MRAIRTSTGRELSWRAVIGLAIATAFSVFHGAIAQAQVVLGQIDTFQDGTVANWTEGLPSPNPPVNVATGGPLGAGDRYLRNESSGGAGAGAKMIMYNQTQWGGNFITAGVRSVSAHMANFGTTLLHMRIAVEGGPGATRYSSTRPVILPADGVWRLVQFSFAPGQMSRVSGMNSLTSTLGSVSEFRLVSAAAGPTYNGDAIAGILGVDNIRALAGANKGVATVPEPSALALMVGASLYFLRRTRRRLGKLAS